MKEQIKAILFLFIFVGMLFSVISMYVLKRTEIENRCYNAISNCETATEINKKCRSVFDSEEIYYQIKMTSCEGKK